MIKKASSIMRKKILPLFVVLMLIAQCVFSQQNVMADDSVYLEITGFQVSTTLEAYRTLYSIADPAGKTEEVGLVYGLTDYVTAADMVVGSTNSTVYSYAGTTAGIAAVDYCNYDGATTYVRTMKFVKNAEFYNTGISVRAYAKLSDGTYVYSNISTTSVYKIAGLLYQGCRMGNATGHEYLYNNILSVVDPSYKTVDYNWTNVIVPAESVTKSEESTAEEKTTAQETTKAQETTAAQETTTVADGYTECILDDNITVGQWGYYVGSWSPATARYLGGTTLDNFSLKITSNGGGAWGVQAFTVPISLNVGSTYTVKVTLNSTTAGASVLFKDDVTDTSFETKTLVAGDNVFTGTYTATADTAKFFFDLGAVAAGTTVKVTSFSLEEKVAETTTVEAETTTQAQEEPTTTPPTNIDLYSYYDGIDVASSSTTGEGNETSDKLFDNNTGTKMFSGDAMNSSPIRVAWKMKQAVVLKRYTLTTANDTASYSYRNPKAWHLYGSNNATSWIQIDTVTDGGMGAVNYTGYTYETDIQDSYQYYLIQFEDNGGYYGFQLSEISMFGDVAAMNTVNGEDLSQYFDSIDTANNTFSGYNSEVPANLFDDDTSTKMFSAESLPRTLAWKLNRQATVYSYSLTTANDNATFTGRLPKSWKLYGSTDGRNWNTLDVVSDGGMQNVNYTSYTYTVDYVGSYQYFKLEITAGQGGSIQLSEIDLYGGVVSPSAYDILLTGDWNLVTSEGYVDELIKLFYNSYPRLYARWGNGSEPTTITFKADRTYDGVAYCAGTTVCVSTTYANANPTDIGFFSHEITHSVQQYGGKLNYGDDVAWWTENMANYGGFRYFHWSNPKYVQVYKATDTSLQDWGYEQYGNNKWFFAYMDSRYPTTKNADGSLNYGLIDSINRLIKANNTGSVYTDDPYAVGTPFNNVVRQVTGYDCIESLRQRYVQELQSGTWTFTGFANYTDNYLTENIVGVPNPEYPMLGEKTHGNKTASQLSSAITSGTNLCSGASILKYSGQTNSNESATKLIDGNLGTKWCATSSNVDGTYLLNQVQHWAIIDLGSEKTFNTYTLYNTQSAEGYGNTTEWEILTSNDGNNWTSVDYQGYNNSSIASFNVGSQTARYVMIKVFNADNGGVGTVRLYEFQLYNR